MLDPGVLGEELPERRGAHHVGLGADPGLLAAFAVACRDHEIIAFDHTTRLRDTAHRTLRATH
ncbi:hypothetical protein [Streptomyces sp. CB02923]|uniref:hypothetical protein n=1 Tax=Streptomyces sp. CB02923 TaxID=1718985 RepID=UPI00093A640E|nr:hypothetical protein [Streptomyces sp. CB02923]